MFGARKVGNISLIQANRDNTTVVWFWITGQGFPLWVHVSHSDTGENSPQKPSGPAIF